MHLCSFTFFRNTRRSGDEDVRGWFEAIDVHATDGVNKMLVANKADVENSRVISTAEGQKLAEALGCRYIETSAKDDANVEESFHTLIRSVLFDMKGALIGSLNVFVSTGM